MLPINIAFYRAIYVSILCLGMITNAYAAIIDLSFDAEVYEVNDPNNYLGNALGLSVDLGDIFTTGYTIDSAPAYTFSGFGFPTGSTTFTVDTVTTYANYEGTALTANTGMPANMYIGNDIDSNGDGEITDAWRVLSELLPASGTRPRLSLGIILFSETATRLDDPSFFVNDSLDGWDNAVSYIITGEGDILMLASIVPSAVPLPPTVWLFGSGLLGLIGLARRKA